MLLRAICVLAAIVFLSGRGDRSKPSKDELTVQEPFHPQQTHEDLMEEARLSSERRKAEQALQEKEKHLPSQVRIRLEQDRLNREQMSNLYARGVTTDYDRKLERMLIDERKDIDERFSEFIRQGYVRIVEGIPVGVPESVTESTDSVDGTANAKQLVSDDKPAGQVTELFDGKTLKNWKVPEFGGEGKVTVKDGQIMIGTGEPMSGITWEGGELPKVDYELTFEAQRIEGNDFFGTITFPVQKDSCSFVLGGWGGGVTGLSTLDGSSAIENETTNFQEFEKGKWYKVRVRVTKTKIATWIDDKQVVDVDYSDKRVSIRIEVELSKPLGFSTYRTTGAIRAVKLTELSAVPVEKIEAVK